MTWSRIRTFLGDDRATSDVEYVLITAMVVLPLLILPAFIVDTNRDHFDRIDTWMNLPFP